MHSAEAVKDSLDVSVRGRQVQVPAIEVCGVTVVLQGRLPRIGEIFDEYWLERASLPEPDEVIAALKARPDRPDLFTFSQRVPDTEPRYRHHTEWDNFAVLPLTSHQAWLDEQVPASTRRNIRASAKRGVRIRVSQYDDAYVQGIKAIYDETPFRAGRKFWHYGKELDAVRRENGTYATRSTYLAADVEGAMVGYLKVVWDRDTAAIMQILSKTAVRDLRPNNALLDETVRQCCARGVKYLLYEKFDYGNKTGDSLTRFKENHGFRRMDIPRYYVPLTTRGALALRGGLHRSLKERLPESVAAPLRALRSRLDARRYGGRDEPDRG